MRKVTVPLMVSLVALLALRSAVATDPEAQRHHRRPNGGGLDEAGHAEFPEDGRITPSRPPRLDSTGACFFPCAQ